MKPTTISEILENTVENQFLNLMSLKKCLVNSLSIQIMNSYLLTSPQYWYWYSPNQKQARSWNICTNVFSQCLSVCTHHITALDSWQPERSSHFMILLMCLSISRRPLRQHQFSLSFSTWTFFIMPWIPHSFFYDLQTISISPKALKQIKLWPIFWKAAKSALRSFGFH